MGLGSVFYLGRDSDMYTALGRAWVCRVSDADIVIMMLVLQCSAAYFILQAMINVTLPSISLVFCA